MSSKEDQIAWAADSLREWGETAKSTSVIYIYGFVSFLTLTAKKDDDEDEKLHQEYKGKQQGSKLEVFSGTLLLLILTIVSLVIQTVIPIAIVVAMELPEGGLCPNKANGLTKFIGLTLCVFFVVLTISMCLSKMRGMCFLRLFCGHHDAGLHGISCGKLFLDVGILANMVSMGAAGCAQYLLFIRNAERDILLLLLQSLAMQFVLTADQKLMTSAWSGLTKKRIQVLLQKSQKDQLKKTGGGAADPEEANGKEPLAAVVDDKILAKVKLMSGAEMLFLLMVSVVGTAWSAGLTICM